jgi:hypothetical protein
VKKAIDDLNKKGIIDKFLYNQESTKIPVKLQG